jgi:hypothetical protein
MNSMAMQQFVVANTVTYTDVGCDRVELDARATYRPFKTPPRPPRAADIGQRHQPIDKLQYLCDFSNRKVRTQPSFALTPDKDPGMSYLYRCFLFAVPPAAQDSCGQEAPPADNFL